MKKSRKGAWLFAALASLVGTVFWLNPALTTVRGDSMEPTLRDGQRCVVLASDLVAARVGDLVVAEAPTLGLVVKRVAATAGQQAPDGPWRRRLALSKTGLGAPATLPGLACDSAGCTVRAGHVFLSSDHQKSSSDSRHFGAVENVIGRVVYCF